MSGFFYVFGEGVMGKDKQICPSCGGSGQISFFQGESRFLLTMEECPECNGTGSLVDDKERLPVKKETGKKNED